MRLKRQSNVYIDDGRGGEITVAAFTKDGTVQFWGNTKRDEVFRQPIIQHYLRQVAAALPGGKAYDEKGQPFPNVRVDGRNSVRLPLLLDHQASWLAAVAALKGAIQDEEADAV